MKYLSKITPCICAILFLIGQVEFSQVVTMTLQPTVTYHFHR